jgi:hypothetical protein
MACSALGSFAWFLAGPERRMQRQRKATSWRSWEAALGLLKVIELSDYANVWLHHLILSDPTNTG